MVACCVRSLLSRLFRSGPRAGRAAVTCHLRENGPIGYELQLFGESPRAQAETLIDSGLSWAWTSGEREWTHLTPVSLSALLADLPGGALILGVEGELPTLITNDMVKAWVRRFCRAESVPLAVAVSIAAGRHIVFVQQHAPATVAALLDALHVDRVGAVQSPYVSLGPASLESVAARLSSQPPA